MKDWLKSAIVYQIYPVSFYDGNGDGIGDFKGITEKLDYVKSLGVDVIWLNPIFKSPFKDGGYDVADYYAVDERFGEMQDFEFMLKRAKELGLKIILDLVIGHTSWECAWFQKSGEKERNPYSDYYIWTDSCFKEYKGRTISGLTDRDGCFMINYYAHQPALNYGFDSIDDTPPDPYAYVNGFDWQMHYQDERLKPLREEIVNIMRFWLQKGVDGFRVDMAASLIKNCKNVESLKWLWNIFFSEIKKEYPQAVFISEWGDPKIAVGEIGFDVDYILHENDGWNSLYRYEKGMNLVALFEKGHNYFSEEGKGNIENFIRQAIDIHATIKGKGYFSCISGSHDEVRLATGKTIEQLKVIFAFLLTFRHLPFLYYGDEIGIAHNFNVSKDGGYIRTGCRTPMQWNEAKNRGFSNNDEPYLPTNEDRGCSVEAQEREEDSLLHTVRKLIEIRKTHSCLNAEGEFKVIACEKGGYPFVYERRDEKGKIVVALNPSKEPKRVNVNGKIIFGQNYKQETGGILLSKTSFVIMEQ